MPMNDEESAWDLVHKQMAKSVTSADPVWTVEEIAARFRISKMSVYRLVHSGELESRRFNRSIRISEKDLQRYFEKHRRT
jgi:excisionase family DNA binding protein